MTRDNKVQLGVRVPADVRGAAVADAAGKGMSLNAYVEHLIVQAHGHRPVVAPLAGQTTIDDILNGQAELPPGEDTMVAHAVPFPEKPVSDQAEISGVTLTAFARNCTNGTLHWRCGPGNPCRFCGGEV